MVDRVDPWSLSMEKERITMNHFKMRFEHLELGEKNIFVLERDA